MSESLDIGVTLEVPEELSEEIAAIRRDLERARSASVAGGVDVRQLRRAAGLPAAMRSGREDVAHTGRGAAGGLGATPRENAAARARTEREPIEGSAEEAHSRATTRQGATREPASTSLTGRAADLAVWATRPLTSSTAPASQTEFASASTPPAVTTEPVAASVVTPSSTASVAPRRPVITILSADGAGEVTQAAVTTPTAVTAAVAPVARSNVTAPWTQAAPERAPAAAATEVAPGYAARSGSMISRVVPVTSRDMPMQAERRPVAPTANAEAGRATPATVEAGRTGGREDGDDAAVASTPVATAGPTQAPAPGEAAKTGPVGGDVMLDGALVGRWIARLLNEQASRPSAGPSGFDARRHPTLPGATVGFS